MISSSALVKALYSTMTARSYHLVVVFVALLCLHTTAVSSAPRSSGTNRDRSLSAKSDRAITTGFVFSTECCKIPKQKGYQEINGLKPKTEICDTKEITLERRQTKDDGLDRMLIVCDLQTGKWMVKCGGNFYYYFLMGEGDW